MPNLGAKSFQNQEGLSVETRRRLDALQDQVDAAKPQQQTIAQRAISTVRAWRQAHPGAVAGGGLRKP